MKIFYERHVQVQSRALNCYTHQSCKNFFFLLFKWNRDMEVKYYENASIWLRCSHRRRNLPIDLNSKQKRETDKKKILSYIKLLFPILFLVCLKFVSFCAYIIGIGQLLLNSLLSLFFVQIVSCLNYTCCLLCIVEIFSYTKRQKF